MSLFSGDVVHIQESRVACAFPLSVLSCLVPPEAQDVAQSIVRLVD